MTLDPKKLELTPEEIRDLRNHPEKSWGLIQEETARAQLVKALDGVVAWLEQLATEHKANHEPLESNACDHAAMLLEQAAHAAGYEWPMKEEE